MSVVFCNLAEVMKAMYLGQQRHRLINLLGDQNFEVQSDWNSRNDVFYIRTIRRPFRQKRSNLLSPAYHCTRRTDSDLYKSAALFYSIAKISVTGEIHNF